MVGQSLSFSPTLSVSVSHAIAKIVSTAGSSLGTGGMSTKIVAARLATSAGVTTIITRSSNPGNIARIVEWAQSGSVKTTISTTTPPPLQPLHTRFLPDPHPIRDRYFWLLHGLAPHGTLFIDEGAKNALVNKAGLLPAGIVAVQGNFAQQEAVRLVVVLSSGRKTTPPPPPSTSGGSSTETIPRRPQDHRRRSNNNGMGGGGGGQEEEEAIGKEQGEEVGRALVNYSSTEIVRIKGRKSSDIHTLLGYADSEYVALRENISFFK